METDYMSDKDFEAIYAVAMEAPDRIGVMVSSTPTGRRGTFYKLCVEMPFNQEDQVRPINTKQKGYIFDNSKYDRGTSEGWKEFHFPSMVNPEWSTRMESQAKKQYSQVAYEHEFLAEFGTETVGVFNKEYLDEAASLTYPFIEQRRTDGPIAIGVDWDKYGATTNIVVLQYDNNDIRRSRPELGMIDNGYGRFKVINHIEIPKSDMQYDIAVQKIIELDKKYNPFGIFPDRGGGEFQIEMLRKHIGKKVRGVFYGETTEVRDPVTNMIEKKSLKPFLINQTTLLLERGQLRIPHPSISDIIHRQMVNYQVVRVSEKTKEPVYSSDDEHGLDAMVFALYGFIEDYPQLIDIIDDIRPETNMTTIRNQSYTYNPMDDIELNPSKNFDSKPKSDDGSPRYRKVPLGFSKRQKKQTTTNSLGWGAFGSKKQGSPWR